VDLPQGNEPPRIRSALKAQRPQKNGAIFLNGGTGVVLGESEAQIMATKGSRKSTGAGAEAMHEPTQTP
jgi:hypothetical protein